MKVSYSTSGTPRQYWARIEFGNGEAELTIPAKSLGHVIRLMASISPDQDVLDWRLELAEQVIEAWNEIGNTGKESDVVPMLMELWRKYH